MTNIPYIPESAPFNAEQRAWLNGFLAGLFSQVPGGMPAPQPNAAPPKTGEPLLILFGSQTGSAEGLAKKLAKESESRGFTPKVAALNDFESAGLITAKKAVIISSTWGDGEPPDNAVNFWNWIKADSAPRLENLNFAVLGLGDRNYSDFCGASKKFDARLEALGAKRLAPRGECDVDYEGPAKVWIDGLWDKLGSTAVNGAPASGPAGANGATKHAGSETGAPKVYGKFNPFPAKLLKNVLLNKPGSNKEVRHYEIDLNGSGLTYEAGDALGVVPVNCPELVDDIIEALKARPEENVKFGDNIMSLREALTHHFDINKPSQELLKAVALRAPSPLNGVRAGVIEGSNEPPHPSPSIPLPVEGRGKHEAALQQLAVLLAPEKREDLKKWLWGRQVIDLLEMLPAPMPVVEFVPLLKRLVPRLYSISSSPKAHPGEVHLTVGAVRYESHGRARKGVASTFLADRVGDAEFVKVFVQPSHGFKPPVNGETPMIMVGPGTGIAPFRAFLEERQASGAKGKNWLFFGDQRRDTDFLYDELLMAWQRSGLLTRLDLAFSRDQEHKIYVQDRMMENAGELWSWLEAGAHFYVCGDASRMAKDVDAALHKIVETGGGKNPDEAKAYVAKLKSDKRYQRDVY
ncbi:MAG TPA: flavodoxin domain-containing protein [Verrucomicrobiae bacterium]|nr:flavodoxin domain-containing protein [Verrucomicrobiae bacterium]